MSREAQIKAGLKLLRPVNTAACEQLLVAALDAVEGHKSETRHEQDVASKEARKALEAYRAAVERTRVTYSNLPEGMTVQRLRAVAGAVALRGRVPRLKDGGTDFVRRWI